MSKPALPDEVYRAVAADYEAGKSYARIKEDHGVCQQTIQKAVRMFDIQPRGSCFKQRVQSGFEAWELDPCWHHKLSVQKLRTPI